MLAKVLTWEPNKNRKEIKIKYKIAVIDDNTEILETLKSILKQENYNVMTFERWFPARDKMKKTPPDLIILDLTLPDVDGIEVCKILKEDDSLKYIPVIMATGRELDETSGLRIGADDYIVKPYTPDKLLARIDAVLRRVHFNGDPEKIIEIEEVYVNISRREVKVKNRHLPLCGTDFNLLTFLMRNPNKVFTKAELLESVWGYSEKIKTRTLDMHISRLRKKLGKASKRIITVTRVGYKFSDEKIKEIKK